MSWVSWQKQNRRQKEQWDQAEQQQQKEDSKVEWNDSPEIHGMRETSDIPSLRLGPSLGEQPSFINSKLVGSLKS